MYMCTLMFLILILVYISSSFHPHNRHLSHNSPRLIFLFVDCATVNKFYPILSYLGSYHWGNEKKLPPSRWHRRGRSLQEVFANAHFLVTIDLCKIYNKGRWGHGTPRTEMADRCASCVLFKPLS